MMELYPGEIADWYEDSSDDEKVMMLSKRCIGPLGYPLYYEHLPRVLKDKVKELFSYDITELDN